LHDRHHSAVHVFKPSALYFLLFLVVFSAYPAWTQTTEQDQRPDFFVAPLAEITGYGRKTPAIGGGFALGAGDGVAIGFRLLYAAAPGGEAVVMLELALFMRFYLLGPEASTGLYIQVTAGAAMFASESAVSLPSEEVSISAGLAVGWRFPLGNHWYIEPAIRAGYPYIAGAGVSAGFRL